MRSTASALLLALATTPAWGQGTARGELRAPPPLESADYPKLAEAPGTYVLER